MKKYITIGGQAVIEGIMMRGKSMYSLAVRNSKGEIVLEKNNFKKSAFNYSKIPILRGIMAFGSSFVLGTKILTRSVELSDIEEENPSKFEKFLIDKLGDKLNNILMFFSMVFAFIIGVSLFMLLPTWITSFINLNFNIGYFSMSLLEGIIRLLIFFAYIYVISKNKDIQTVFMYHGAEHKTINCIENNETLTIENIKKHSRIHKRCGTSFLFIVMLVSAVLFMFVRVDDIIIRTFSRILFLPLIAGFSYEILKISNKTNNFIIQILVFPGLLLQKLTTKEPNEKQIEVAIKAINAVIEAEGITFDEN